MKSVEKFDHQSAFRESIDDLIAQIKHLEASLGIPEEGAGSSSSSFDGIWKQNDHSQFTVPVYLGMARFLLELVDVANAKSEGRLIKFLLKALGLANQCVATARAVADRGSINGQLFNEFAKLRHAEIVQNGKKGIEKRYAPMRQLQTWAVEKYQSGKWPSANAAAVALEEQVIAHGRTINATLSKTNARRTIAEWFRKSV